MKRLRKHALPNGPQGGPPHKGPAPDEKPTDKKPVDDEQDTKKPEDKKPDDKKPVPKAPGKPDAPDAPGPNGPNQNGPSVPKPPAANGPAAPGNGPAPQPGPATPPMPKPSPQENAAPGVMPSALPQGPGSSPKPKSLDDAKLQLQNVVQAADDMADSYLTLFQTLTALYSTYPQLYNTMKLTARFPNQNDTAQIDQMRDNLREMADMYLSDEDYLAEACGLPKGSENPAPAPAQPSPQPTQVPAPAPVNDNAGDDQGLPPVSTPKPPTPGMSPSSKQPFADIMRSSNRLLDRIIRS